LAFFLTLEEGSPASGVVKASGAAAGGGALAGGFGALGVDMHISISLLKVVVWVKVHVSKFI